MSNMHNIISLGISIQVSGQLDHVTPTEELINDSLVRTTKSRVCWDEMKHKDYVFCLNMNDLSGLNEKLNALLHIGTEFSQKLVD